MFSAKPIKVSKINDECFEFKNPNVEGSFNKANFDMPAFSDKLETVKLSANADNQEEEKVFKKEKVAGNNKLNQSEVDPDFTPMRQVGESTVYHGIDKDGKGVYRRYDPETDTYHYISIFDEENTEKGQYGANQMEFTWRFDRLIQDPFIWNEMQKHYPIEDFDSIDAAMEFYERYFKNISNTGCGYAAAANIIFKEYEGREKEFEETFGFKMYTVYKSGRIDFNYEYLMLMYFNYDWANKYSLEDMENKKIWRGIWSGHQGTSAELETFDEFLKQYGINCTSEEDDTNRFAYWKREDKQIDTLKDLDSKNEHVIYGGSGYGLYTMDGEEYTANGESHYLYIVGYNDKGQPIVSSWGNKYIMDIKGDDLKFLENDKYRYTIVNID